MRFVAPVAIIVGITSLVITPWANRQASEFKARYEQRSEVSRVTPGQFRESADGSKVFFVEGFDPSTASVQNVLVNSVTDGKVSVIVSKTGHVERQAPGTVTDGGRRPLALRRVEVGDDHPCALGGVAFANRPADATRAAGHHRDLAFKLHLRIPTSRYSRHRQARCCR